MCQGMSRYSFLQYPWREVRLGGQPREKKKAGHTRTPPDYWAYTPPELVSVRTDASLNR